MMSQLIGLTIAAGHQHAADICQVSSRWHLALGKVVAACVHVCMHACMYTAARRLGKKR